MVTRGSRKEGDRGQAEKYRRVGAALLESAQVLTELADEGDGYGNAIAVVAVHACIACNDALSIAWKGVKSTEGDHTRAPDTLLFALSHQLVVVDEHASARPLGHAVLGRHQRGVEPRRSGCGS
jgi:hypothetical protein